MNTPKSNTFAHRSVAASHYEPLEDRTLFSVLTVDDDRVQKPRADFTSIQLAVNAAQPGDTIRVFPGTYNEHVTISSAKSNLTLRSDSRWDAVVHGSGGADDDAIFKVNGAQNVSIQGFTVAGTATGLDFGVLVQRGGSGTIRDNHITSISEDPISGVQTGVGVAVFNSTVEVRDNVIDDYQKNGMVVDGRRASAQIVNNVVRGVGSTSVIAQNGIQVSSGAVALVKGNSVYDNLHSPSDPPDDYTALGIYLFDAGAGTVVSQNIVYDNDENIVVQETSGATVEQNETFHATYEGIGLFNADNTIVRNNHSYDNGSDGILVDLDSTGNRLSGNRLSGNGEYDAEDDSMGTGTAGTANTWENNRGQTESRPGLLKR